MNFVDNVRQISITFGAKQCRSVNIVFNKDSSFAIGDSVDLDFAYLGSAKLLVVGICEDQRSVIAIPTQKDSIAQWFEHHDIARPQIYFRSVKEPAWNFFLRCLGRLKQTDDTSLDWEFIFPVGSCLVRPIAMSNMVFVDSVIRHVKSLDWRVSNWTTLDEENLRLVVCSGKPYPLPKTWVPSNGLTANHLYGLSPDQGKLRRIISGKKLDFIFKLLTSKNKAKLNSWPLCPQLVSKENVPFLCERIDYTLELKHSESKGEIHSGEAEMWVRSPEQIAARSPIPETELTAEFSGWEDENWAKFKLGDQYSVVESFPGADAERANPNIIIGRIVTCGRVGQDGRDGLFFNPQEGDRFVLRIPPGGIPTAYPLIQNKSDISDGGRLSFSDKEGVISSKQLTVNDSIVVSDEETVFSHKVKIKDVEIG